MKVVNHNRMSVQIEDVKPGEVFIRYGYSDPLIKVADVDKDVVDKEYEEHEKEYGVIFYYGVSLLDGQCVGIVKGSKVLICEAEVHIV